MNIRLLKIINYISITISVVLTVLFFINLLSNTSYRNDGNFIRMIPSLITQPLLSFLSLIILIKTKQQIGNLMFALFLSLLSVDWILVHFKIIGHNWVSDVFLLCISIITGTVFIKAFQYFPRQITEEDIKSVFPKGIILSKYATFTIKNNSWLIFPLILVVIALFVSTMLMNVFILITGLIVFYVNFKKSSLNERNKILWLFWGVLTYSFLVITYLLLNYFNKENSDALNVIFNVLKNFVLLFSLFMSLFFSNTFDTGILIRQTLVDSAIFIIIIIVYNTVEHYFLHWLSHTLEISNVLLSSLLSGILVLVFNPVHHKLMNYLKQKVKKNPIDK